MNVRPLHVEAGQLCEILKAPPRLVTHLTLVHDVACELVERFFKRFPSLEIDGDALRFGAAIHDIGKVFAPEELSGPGNRHEELGALLLVEHGVPAHLARFARTHGRWRVDPSLQLEDLLVALADNLWRGKRDAELEELISKHIPGRPWEVLIAFDEIIEPIAAKAEERLAWQRHFLLDG